MADVKKFIDLSALGLYDAKIKTYIGQQIESANHLMFEKVDSLPALENAKANVIYLVARGAAGQKSADVFDEYFLINGAFELIGNTAVDFGNYYTKSEVDGLISDMETKTHASSTYVAKEDGKGLVATAVSSKLSEKDGELHVSSDTQFNGNVSFEGTATVASPEKIHFTEQGFGNTLKDYIEGKEDAINEAIEAINDPENGILAKAIEHCDTATEALDNVAINGHRLADGNFDLNATEVKVSSAADAKTVADTLTEQAGKISALEGLHATGKTVAQEVSDGISGIAAHTETSADNYGTVAVTTTAGSVSSVVFNPTVANESDIEALFKVIGPSESVPQA